MECVKCGSEIPQNLRSTQCAACLKAQPVIKSSGPVYVVLALFGSASLIVLFFILKIVTPWPNSNFAINDTGVLHGETVCMETENALHAWTDHANEHDDLAMRMTFASSGVAMLHSGDKVIVTELGKDAYRVKLSGGEQCWLPGGILDRP
jgi:hypothetical protein